MRIPLDKVPEETFNMIRRDFDSWFMKNNKDRLKKLDREKAINLRNQHFKSFLYGISLGFNSSISDEYYDEFQKILRKRGL